MICNANSRVAFFISLVMLNCFAIFEVKSSFLCFQNCSAGPVFLILTCIDGGNFPNIEYFLFRGNFLLYFSLKIVSQLSVIDKFVTRLKSEINKLKRKMQISEYFFF